MGKSKVANGTKPKTATKADLAEAKPKKSVKIAPPKVESDDDSASEDSDSEDSDKSEPEADSDSASDGSDDGSDGSSDDSESDEEDKPKPKGKAAPNGKVNGKAKAAAADEDDDSDDSDSSESSDDEKTTKPKSTAAANGTDKKPAATADDESRSDDSDDSASESGSDSGSDDDEDAEDTTMTDAKAPAAVSEKKRKAEDADEKPFKKARADESEKEATTNLFVGNLSWNVDDNTLYEEFKHCGEILAARVITDRESGRSRGFGYVDFANEADATKAYTEKQGWFIDGRQIKIDYASGGNKNDSRPRNQNGAASRAQKYGDTPSAPSETLFIGNLSFQANEDSVSEFFNSVAPVQSLRLITDKDTGNMKGFGYVTFGSVEDAKNALDSLNGEDCAGRNVRLDYSTPKPQQSGGFGGGRGGRGGFGGRGGRGGFGDRGGRGGFGGRGGGARGGRAGGYAGKKISFD